MPQHPAPTRIEADSPVSICIPTYKRPGYLDQALKSCLAQTYSNIEIVIGDDSPDDETRILVEGYIALHPHVICYQQNKPSLGQNANVNDLFRRASWDRLILLHDDDLLEPTAVEDLAACWQHQPPLDGAFGKQYYLHDDGTPADPKSSEELNTAYRRTAENAGLQEFPLAAGIARMFPNDGFMIRTSLAQAIGYRSKKDVGDACDTDFGIRFCAAAQSLWYLDKFTCGYRMSSESVSRTAIVAPYTYRMLRALYVPAELESLRAEAEVNLAPSAVSGLARLGHTREALRLFLSNRYPLRQRLSQRGIYHMLLMLRSVTRPATG